MATMQLIGRPKRKRGGTGITLDAEFLFTGTTAELDTAMPTLGILPITGMTANAANVAWNKQMGVSNSNAEVTASDADWLGGTGDNSMWSVRITVSDGDSSGGGGQTKTPENLKNKIESGYSTKEIFLDPVWWGLMKADKDMTGKEPFKTQTMKINNVDTLIEYYKEYVNTKGVACLTGDFVYKNANPTVWTISTATDGSVTPFSTYINGTLGFPAYSAGSVNALLSPYVGPASTNVEHAGKKCKTIVYSVTFYKKGNLDADFADWWGINPAGGFGTPVVVSTGGPPVAKNKVAPTDSTTHKWKALENRVERLLDTNQEQWMKITRTMESAPDDNTNSWKWDNTRSYHKEWEW